MVAVLVPRLAEATEVEVRKKRRGRPSQRSASAAIASLCRDDEPSFARSLIYRRREPALKNREHGAVGYSRADTPHQWAVPDRGK